jgi:nitrate/nitrite transport system substrate-binding protein
VATGVSKAQGDPLKIAMVINNNGQATTLSSKAFGGLKYADFAGLKTRVDALKKAGNAVVRHDVSRGTHDMWMHLTLAQRASTRKKCRSR